MRTIIIKKYYRRILAAALAAALFSGCGPAATAPSAGKIAVVGAENEYADVARQIGGEYISVTALIASSSVDPHTYQASTRDAAAVSEAELLVENGLGYDDFMDKLASGTPNSRRVTINVASALGYSENTKNPHLWYHPDTMSKTAALIAKALEKQLPDKKAYFEDNLRRFNDSLQTWKTQLSSLKKQAGGAGAAVTEPVSDYLLEAAGLDNKTPWAYQAAVMNGIDPSPQDVKTQQELFTLRSVKVFLYNRQAENASTKALLELARKNKIPVVGIYETMPAGYTYQKWMETETQAIQNAVLKRVSDEQLFREEPQ